MHTVLLRAFEGHTGTGKLGQAVDVICLDSHGVLNVVPHLLRPCFRTEDACLQRDVIRAESHLLHPLSKISRIGGRAAKDGCAEVIDEHDLPVCIAGGSRNRETSDLMRAAIQSGAAGE